MRKFYIVKKGNEYHDQKSNLFTKKRLFATIYSDYKNAFKIASLNEGSEVISVDEKEQLLVYEFIGFDLTMKLEVIRFTLLEFGDKFQAFSMVSKAIIPIIIQLIKLLKKNDVWFERYCGNNEEETLKYTKVANDMYNELSKLPVTEYENVLKYLKTKNKKIKI